MKNKVNKIKKNIITFIIFLLILSINVTVIIFLYDLVKEKTSNNPLWISIDLLLSIIVFSIILALLDSVRRKIMVKRPVNEILVGTNEIINGNYKYEIKINHQYNNFDEFDIIKYNINLVIKELAKNELLSNDFISNVSHEIKTPLSIIYSYANELKNNKLSQEEKNEYLSTIIEASFKLNNLVLNILKLNKLDNQVIFNNEKINITNVIEDVVINYSDKLDKKNINLDCDLNDIYLIIDKGLLEIVLNNLLSNAIKFTNNNGNIKIILKNIDGFVTISVIDDGVGMDSITGSRIFDKFYQGDTSHQSEGNGLGLALVKRVIDIIGGEIIVKSKLNEGSNFTIRIRENV